LGSPAAVMSGLMVIIDAPMTVVTKYDLSLIHLSVLGCYHPSLWTCSVYIERIVMVASTLFLFMSSSGLSGLCQLLLRVSLSAVSPKMANAPTLPAYRLLSPVFSSWQHG
jgi:hypothetical protein